MKVINFLLPFVVLLFLYDAALACRCPPRKLSTNVSRSLSVFSGKVTKITFNQLPAERGRYTVILEVEQVWKGEIKKKITLITQATSCDIRFREGESYLVFASMHKDASELTTDICSGTGLVIERKENIEMLGEGEIPEADKP